MTNPLLSEYKTPYNSIPFTAIKPEHFRPAFDSVIAECRKLIDDIIKNKEKPTFENTIVALERSTYRLNVISNILFNLNYAATNEKIQSTAKEISPLLSEFNSDIILNETLFERIEAVYNETDKTALNTEDTKLLIQTYEDFVRNGANLSSTDKETYRHISKELSQLTIEFSEHVLAETNDYYLHLSNSEDLKGLPESVIESAAEEAKSRDLDGWVFTMQFPSMGPFIKYNDNRELRKELSMASGTRCLKDKNDNTEIIKHITELRLHLANLLGYKTYADFILSKRMAESTATVKNFLNNMLEKALPVAQKEYEEIQKFAMNSGADFTIESWDWTYYSEKLKLQKFDIDDELTRPYFRLEEVQKGVFGLASQLFGLNFKENLSIPVYHKDVKVYEVFDADTNFLALLYMDFFPRESKKSGAWMTEFVQQHKTSDGVDIRPHVSLVFNFTKPTKTKPSLLTYNEVRTLLHEFGHALHGMMSNCTYEQFAGTNVYRDFVELPSQLLENWADEKEWLNKIALHYQTGEAIPDTLVDKIIAARNFNVGYATVRQLSFGLNDLSWHTLTDPFKGDIIDFEKKAMAPARILPEVDGTAMSPTFTHIFSGGYASGYYSYKWAEVLDADAFAYFKENGIFNKEIAASYRKNILSKGGTEHPMDLYIAFRGKEPSIDALLERSGMQ